MKDDNYVTKMESLKGKWAQDEANYDRVDDFSHAETLQLLDEGRRSRFVMLIYHYLVFVVLSFHISSVF